MLLKRKGWITENRKGQQTTIQQEGTTLRRENTEGTQWTSQQMEHSGPVSRGNTVDHSAEGTQWTTQHREHRVPLSRGNTVDQSAEGTQREHIVPLSRGNTKGTHSTTQQREHRGNT